VTLRTQLSAERLCLSAAERCAVILWSPILCLIRNPIRRLSLRAATTSPAPRNTVPLVGNCFYRRDTSCARREALRSGRASLEQCRKRVCWAWNLSQEVDVSPPASEQANHSALRWSLTTTAGSPRHWATRSDARPAPSYLASIAQSRVSPRRTPIQSDAASLLVARQRRPI